MHKNIRAAMNKVQDFVASPQVNKVTKIASGVLEVAAQIGQARLGGPVAVVGAAMGTLEVVQRHLGVEPADLIHDWFDANPELVYKGSTLPQTLVSAGAIEFLSLRPAIQFKDTTIEVLTHDGKRCALKKVGKDGEAVYENYVWLEDGFDERIFASALWKAVAAPIVKLTMANGAKGFAPALEPSQYDDVAYLGKNSPKAFSESIEIYRRNNISRASLLVGAPGTGKTSFCRAYARDTKQTLFIVPPDFLSSSSRVAMERLVRLMQPGILLFDDIDRAPAGLAYAMNIVDDLRRAYPQIVVISTVNQLDRINAALLRPGRLGKRVRFLSPPGEEKLELLSFYMKRYGVDATKFDLPELVAAMDHENFSHDYVRFVAEEAVALDQEKLLVSIQDMCDLLNIAERMEPALDGGILASGFHRLQQPTAAAPEPHEDP